MTSVNYLPNTQSAVNQLIDRTLALRVVLGQSGLTINGSPHTANHYMFDLISFNFTRISLSPIVSAVVRCCRRLACKLM